ncbi:hypothetical protein ACJMK2_006514 [Sinanodonta woodiana]|uniref:Sulfotransferase domain-containing protein n=1 Tax=Sinanodonta woodiana TaxID=1069815 RepID=A0ABD3VTC6_SINWO
MTPGWISFTWQEKFHFDPRFKNPCWFEPLVSPDPYQRNIYSSYSSAVKRSLKQMTLLWRKRFSHNVSSSYRLRCLPYFYIIGQPKSGSTDLFFRISRHPDVVTPPIKEFHWWSRGRQGRQVSYSDLIPLENYIDMFDKVAFLIESRSSSQGPSSSPFPVITGEASVSLFWDNSDWYNYPENQHFLEPQYTNPDYIHHLLPDVKLILIVRNPTDRLYSDYLYFTETNKSAMNFHKAVVKATNLYNNCTRMRSVRECVYDEHLAMKSESRLRLGLYSVYLDDWLRVFERNQILILRLEDYAVNREHTMKNIFKFLKLRDLSSEKMKYILEKPIENQRSIYNHQLGNMLPETRKLLDDYFSPFNKHFAELVNDQRFLWKEYR